MRKVLVFQPYLSNRTLSSNTIERQFRFLTKDEDTRAYVLLDKSEVDYANHLAEDTKFYPIVEDLASQVINKLQKQYNFEALYIARTYFTPATQENVEHLIKFDFDENDDRYWRDFYVKEFAELGVPVHHIIYDPLELQYDEIIKPESYIKYSSMTNVDGAKAHNFADIGYYDKGKEVDIKDKIFKFTFGGTAFSEERERLVKNIYDRMKNLLQCNLHIRTTDTNNLVDNSVYEELTSKSLFTYTIPSQCDKYMSFTRMLLALSQGTIPLIHQDNNLDCLFGEGFEFREDLQEFFEKLIMTPEQLQEFIQYHSIPQLHERYLELMNEWHQTRYYQWLQSNC